MGPSPARVSGVVRCGRARLFAPLICVPLWLAALVVLEARAAQAAPASGPANDKQARELFQSAENSFNLGRFADALADYQGAYQAKPLPAFLFNIAQCYRNMQSYERARFFLRRYLALEPHSPNRRLVEDLIAEMTRELDKADKADKSDKGHQNDDHLAAPVALAAAPASAPVVTPPPAPPPSRSGACARARARGAAAGGVSPDLQALVVLDRRGCRRRRWRARRVPRAALRNVPAGLARNDQRQALDRR